jgi:hypothetical protein
MNPLLVKNKHFVKEKNEGRKRRRKIDKSSRMN